MIKSKPISGIVFIILLSLTYSCQQDQSSEVKSGFDTFASSPLLADQPCNLDELSCKYQPQVLEKQQELAAILQDLDTSHPQYAPQFIRHIPINREQLETASHSCEGNICEAVVLVSTPIAHMDIPVGIKTKAVVTYSRAVAEDDSIAMAELKVAGHTKAFNIGEFISVNAHAAITVRAPEENLSLDQIEYDFSWKGDITAKMPYISFKVGIDERGIALSGAMNANFKSDFLKLNVPVLSGSRMIPYSEIKNNFINSVASQNFDPQSETYWDHFADRLAVMDGY